MNTRFLVGIGVAFALVFIGGVAAVVGVNSVADRPSVIDVSPVPSSAPEPAIAPAPAVADSLAALPNPAAASQPIPAQATGPLTPQPVLDADLAQLAAAVKLGASSTGDVTKDVWAREVPVAQNLLKGMCDCDQRNWLKHFVETGQEAISGSDHYPESVALLTKLRRGNNDLNTAQAAR
jgi:hypothetical protein